MKEIGGYFELEHFFGEEYHNRAIRLNSARSCLHYLLEANSYKKIYIPYFLCKSIEDSLKKFKIAYEFYIIDAFPNFNFPKTIQKHECIYIVDYYGLLNSNNIIKYKEKYHNIIVDSSQAFFKYPENKVDTLYSCRKFFGVPDGAYVYSNKIIKTNLEDDVSNERFDHLLGRFEHGAELYYTKFQINNQILSHKILMNMSKLTQNIMQGINYELVIKRRTENFRFLHSKLKDINILKFKDIYAPFCYPLVMQNDNLRQKLINEKIYIPILWPNCLNCSDKHANFFAKYTFPIPCDQRYDCDDMTYIIKKIYHYI